MRATVSTIKKQQNKRTVVHHRPAPLTAQSVYAVGQYRKRPTHGFLIVINVLVTEKPQYNISLCTTAIWWGGEAHSFPIATHGTETPCPKFPWSNAY